jgi:hypothetical protein
MRSYFHFFHFSKQAKNFKYQTTNPEMMCMKNSELNREFDKLLEGRMKRLDRMNLKEELDVMESVSGMMDRDGDEVFGE